MDPYRIISQKVCLGFSQLNAWDTKLSYDQNKTESLLASFIRDSITGYILSGFYIGELHRGLSALDQYLVLSNRHVLREAERFEGSLYSSLYLPQVCFFFTLKGVCAKTYTSRLPLMFMLNLCAYVK